MISDLVLHRVDVGLQVSHNLGYHGQSILKLVSKILEGIPQRNGQDGLHSRIIVRGIGHQNVVNLLSLRPQLSYELIVLFLSDLEVVVISVTRSRAFLGLLDDLLENSKHLVERRKLNQQVLHPLVLQSVVDQVGLFFPILGSHLVNAIDESSQAGKEVAASTIDYLLTHISFQMSRVFNRDIFVLLESKG